MNKPNKRIYIFDTTLRDGQQCPGAGMNFENNIRYAKLAANVNIDIFICAIISQDENVQQHRSQ